MEAIDTIRLASDCDPERFVVHPLFTHSLMHIVGFVSNLHGGVNGFVHLVEALASRRFSHIY